MALSFDNLSKNLVQPAENVAKFLSSDLGVKNIVAEKTISDSVHWVPTLSGIQTNHHLVYVDVTDAQLPYAMTRYLAQLMQEGSPALIYVAITESASESTAKTYEEAVKLGVGILKVSGSKIERLRNPVSVSLAGLRRIVPKDHQKKFRQDLLDAQETFLNGDPVGGCQRVHQEVEALSRKVCKSTYDHNLWDPSYTRNVRWDGPWKNVLTTTTKNVDINRAKARFPQYNDSVLYTLAGLCDQRNLESHKPKNKQQLQKRDSRCRTVFESAVDTFKDLQVLAKVLKVR